mgnify:CR=1 FL=1
MRISLLTPTLAFALLAPLGAASAKVANIEFSGQGFAESGGFFAGAPALSWTGRVTLDLAAEDEDDEPGRGLFTSSVSNLEFSLPALGVNFTSAAPQRITEIQVAGNGRTLALEAVNIDSGIEAASAFTLTDLGSIFTPIDDTLPQTELAFGAFDELAFSLAFADATGAEPVALGNLLVTPDTASLEIVTTPLPAALGFFGAGLALLGILWKRGASNA